MIVISNKPSPGCHPERILLGNSTAEKAERSLHHHLGQRFLHALRLVGMTLFLISTLGFTAHAKVLDIQKVTSPGGLTAWLVEDESVPIIALNFTFEGIGAAQDPTEKQGLSRLASNIMDEGAGDLTSEQFQKELADLSISLRFNVDRDDFGGSLKTLTRNKDRAFEMLNLALTEPRFDEEPLQRMVAANKSRIRSSLSDPEWIAARIMNDQIYADHPYALNSGGTLSSLETITPEDLRQFVQTRLSKDRLKIAVAGDISGEELGPLLDQIFGALPEEPQNISAIADIPLQNAGAIIHHPKEIPQTIIEIIQPGIDPQDEHFQHAQILNYIFGSSGFGSRLTEEIREKRGLTYGIYSRLHDMDHSTMLKISSSTGNETAGELIETSRDTALDLLENGIDDEELETAKTYLIGSLPLFLTSTDRISGFLLNLQKDGRDIDYLEQRAEKIRNASIEDIQNIAEKILRPADWTVILVGNPENITPTKTIESLPNVE